MRRELTNTQLLTLAAICVGAYFAFGRIAGLLRDARSL